MTTLIEPAVAIRIAELARRLGFDSPDATEQVLDMALEYLEDSVAGRERWRTRQYWDDSSQRHAADLARQGHADGLDAAASGNGWQN